MPRQLYFLHIPKTAGTTLNFAVFPQLFDAEDTCPAYAYPQLMRIPPPDLARYRLFRGHFYYYLHRLLPEMPLYMTFLRDPVDRALSLYEYVLRSPQHYQHKAVASLTGGIHDFVQSPELLAPDFQVTALSFDVDVRAKLADAQARQQEPIDEQRVLTAEMIRRPPSRADLETACRRIEDFAFIGITEHFDQSVRLLSRQFGWAPLRSYESLNVAPGPRVRRAQLAPDVLEEISRTHQLDTELYAFAKRLFYRRLSESGLGQLPV
jgi:Galactose-3-O-sulfotransferase